MTTTVLPDPSLTTPTSQPSRPHAAVPAVPADPYEPLSVGHTVHSVADMAIEKAHHPAAYLVRSLIGGALVAFGVLLSIMVSLGIATPGLQSLVMGLAFGMSLVLILVSGSSLITADMAAGALAVFQRRLSIGGYGKLLFVGMVGNVAGAAIFTLVVAAAGGPYLGAFAQRAAMIATAKTAQPFGTAVLLGILCTWFLQTAMVLYFKARSDVAKMSFAFYGPFAFVIAGTQHVIANVGFLGLPLLLKAFHGPEFAAAEAPLGVTWGFGAHGLLTSLAVVTLGNFIGGTLFVALPFHVVARLQAAGK